MSLKNKVLSLFDSSLIISLEKDIKNDIKLTWIFVVTLSKAFFLCLFLIYVRISLSLGFRPGI